MIIVFDHDFDSTGGILSTHSIDTSTAIVQTMLTALKGNVAAQVTAGYAVISKHPSYVGQTRWQAVIGEVVRLNDSTARGILGV